MKLQLALTQICNAVAQFSRALELETMGSVSDGLCAGGEKPAAPHSTAHSIVKRS